MGSLGDLHPFIAIALRLRELGYEVVRVSCAVARQLHQRAVLLVGAEESASYHNERSADVFVCDYAPFSELFPHALVIIHHGGIGTVGQALRAGKPQLVVPYHSDQFDNAARVVKLGVGRSVKLKQYAPGRAAAELSSLFTQASYGLRATAIGREIRAEDGSEVAARIVDSFLGLRSGRA